MVDSPDSMITSPTVLQPQLREVERVEKVSKNPSDYRSGCFIK